ncbi:MAG: ComEC/Rec2 family competence protein [Patescibacteria group bacterium]
MIKGEFFTKSKILLVSCLSFIAGIGLGSYFSEEWLLKDLWWFGIFAAGALALIIIWNVNLKEGSRFSERWKAISRLLFLFLTFFFFGIWRYSLAAPKDYPDQVRHYNGQRVKIIGRVADEADTREASMKLKIDAKYLLISAENVNSEKDGDEIGTGARERNAEDAGREIKMPVRGRILTTVNIFPEYGFGDRLELSCDLKKPEPVEDFSYDRYLSRYDIYSLCYYPKIKFLGKENFRFFSVGRLYEKVLAVRKKIKTVSDLGMGDPESSIAQAITFGLRNYLPQELKDVFSQTGLTHIMAVSGANISILTMIVMNSLLALGAKRKLAFRITVAWIIFFVILVAAPASAIRAGVMGFIVLWALNLGRLNKTIGAIVLAAAVMLLFNPKILRDDLGFQLSFLATLSLVYFYPIFSAWFARREALSRAPKIISETLLITLAAQVLTTPVLVYNFHFISLSAPLANLLALWAILPITFFTFSGLVFSLIFAGYENLIFFPAWIFVKYLSILAKNLACLPFSHPETGQISGFIFLIYYLMLAKFLKKRKNTPISIDFS